MGGNFPSCDPWVIFSFPPGVGFLLCVSTAAGGVWVWTGDLCRLCCGSSSSAVLTGVVVFGSETSRLFFHEAERMYCIVLTTRKHWGFG